MSQDHCDQIRWQLRLLNKDNLSIVLHNWNMSSCCKNSCTFVTKGLELSTIVMSDSIYKNVWKHQEIYMQMRFYAYLITAFTG